MSPRSTLSAALQKRNTLHGPILYQLRRSAFRPLLRTLRSSRSISFCASAARYHRTTQGSADCATLGPTHSSAREHAHNTARHHRPADTTTSATALNPTAIHRTATDPACTTSARASAKIFRRWQSSADRRRNCSGSRSRSLWRGALWRPLGQAQSIFYYWQIVWV